MQLQKEFRQDHFYFPYLLHIPDQPRKSEEQKLPLIFFLHGAGERGTDLELVKNIGILKFIDDKDDFPFIVVAPQCQDGSYWTEALDGLVALLKKIVMDYSVDTNRIYLTGLSMGGIGAWNLALKHPHLFAALVPVCGSVLLPEHRRSEFKQLVAPENLWSSMDVLKDMPVWAFHGDRDEVVPMDETVQLIEYLKKCNNNVHLTIYPGVGHDSWTPAYQTEHLYTWLGKQAR
ncbi:carboxylesterase family protein [Gracilibacillus oryzae]|uniref:carboxylesterase family protein n=1 Tax=Gracilibacillus oryzae TaxID=1672701 RepID=UPI001D19217A|nr:prolyl oligopeptidase family serine peptidase [Gracilibacillus oryzae]